MALPLVGLLAPLAAALGRMLLWLVASYGGQWVLKTLLALGIGVVTHTVGTPALMSFIQARASGLSGFLFQCFGAIGADVGFSMIISATVAAVTGSMVLRAISR